jgi:hypothetical protein
MLACPANSAPPVAALIDAAPPQPQRQPQQQQPTQPGPVGGAGVGQPAGGAAAQGGAMDALWRWALPRVKGGSPSD